MTKISSKDASIRNLELCKIAPVIPVLIIEDISSARGLGEALVAGGLPVLEVTLRTQCALQAISEMSKIKGGIVGAGTLITYNDVKNAVDAGATFGFHLALRIILLMPAKKLVCHYLQEQVQQVKLWHF